MKNIESADKFHLGRLLEQIRSGAFVIPDFQREFEWAAPDVNDLMRSIFSDFYIGTILLWKASKDNIDVLNCEPIRGQDKEGTPQHIVLDGQQRLTAMYLAFFNPDIPFPNKKRTAAFYLHLDRWALNNSEEAFTYAYTRYQVKWDDFEQSYRGHWFPLSLIGKDYYAALDWARGYIDYWEKEGQNEESELDKDDIDFYVQTGKDFNTMLRGLLNEYYVTYIELDKDIDIGKVCEIFTKINSKGVPLDIFDLLNAILRPHGIYLKDLWRDHAALIPYTDDSKFRTYILQIMSIWSQNYCSPKYLYYLVPNAKKVIVKDNKKDIIHLITSPNEFEGLWQLAFKALKKGFEVISNSNEYGAIKSRFLPYQNLMHIFSALLHHIDTGDYKNKIEAKRKLKLLYWSNVLTQRYSSSTESKAAKDYVDMQKWLIDDNEEPDVVEDFKRDFGTINFISRKSGALYNAVLNLIVLNGARDWYTFDLPDYSELDDHHIVPNSWGKENGLDSINSICNRTLLTPDTNRHILRNKLPNVYIKTMFDEKGEEQTRKILHKHLLSDKAIDILLREDFTANDYQEFIEERQSTIYTAIDTLILSKDDVVEAPASMQKIWEDVEHVEDGLRTLIESKLSDISDNPFEEFVDFKTKESADRKLSSYLKKFPSKTEDDFSSFKDKLSLLTMGELTPLIVQKKLWMNFEPVLKNKSEVDKRIQQILSFRNPYAHNNFNQINETIINDAKAGLAWFKEVLN